MSTIIFPSPIFGPVHSRRLGVSLGINLLPGDGKVCSFDCIYCECGYNADFRTHSGLPTREKVYQALEEKLQHMQKEGVAPNVLTFAGNGEPTLHPHFSEIITDTLKLRDTYFPEAKVSVLTNGTMLHKRKVFEALEKVDNNIIHLDTVNNTYIQQLNRPQGHYDVQEQIKHIKAFQGTAIVQTIFLKGTHEGKSVDNTSDAYVLPWIEALKEIAPRQVMIYTIERETPDLNLEKASHEELDRIATLLRGENMDVSVSY